MNRASSRSQQTQRQILAAALTHFAQRGYAGTSIHDIAASAQVAKPALYYHFGSKAGLFRALMGQAEEEIFSALSNAAARASLPTDQLVEVCVAVFQLATSRGQVMRLALGHSLLAKGAVPAQSLHPKKARRRLGVIRKLIDQGLANGIFRRGLDAEQLTLGFVGLLQSHLVAHLANPRHLLTRRRAQDLVHLFLHGAGAAAMRSGDSVAGLCAHEPRDKEQL